MSCYLCNMDVRKPVDLYFHPVSPPCRAVLMLAKELDVPLNIKFVDVLKGGTLEESFTKLNFMHTIPTVVDGDLTLWESRAIMMYLVNKYAPGSHLYPKNARKRAVIDMLLFVDIGNIYKAIFEFAIPIVMFRLDPDPIKEDKLKEALVNMEALLNNGDNPFLTGYHITIADLSLYAGITFLQVNLNLLRELIDYDLSAYPNIRFWISILQKQLPYDDEVTRIPHEEFKALLQA